MVFFAFLEFGLYLFEYEHRRVIILSDKEGIFTPIINNTMPYGLTEFYKIINDEEVPVYADEMNEGYNLNDVMYHNRSIYRQECNYEKNRTRIIFVGDSVLNSIRQSLIKELSGRDSCKRIDAHIFSVLGYNLNQIMNLVKHDVIPCNPDIVVYGFFQNDMSDNYMMKFDGEIGEGMYFYTRPKYFRDLPLRKNLEKTRSYWFFEDKISGLILRFTGNNGTEERLVENFIIEDMPWERMRLLNEIVKSSGAELVIINFPYLNSNEYETFRFPYQVSEQFDIPLIDVREGLIRKEIDYKQIRISPIDYYHYNRNGSLIVSEIIANGLYKARPDLICDNTSS